MEKRQFTHLRAGDLNIGNLGEQEQQLSDLSKTINDLQKKVTALVHASDHAAPGDALAHYDFFGSAVFAKHFAAYVVVFTFDFVRERFTQIMDECGIFRCLDVRTDFFGDHTGNMRHFG